MNKFLLLSLFLLGGLFLFSSSRVFAQNAGISLAVSPLVFEITGNPGEVIENQIKITNRSESQIEIKISIEDIAPSDEAGHVVVEPAETETYSIARWVQTDLVNFPLESGEAQWVKFKITIPENAEPGGHYGSIVAAGSVVAGSQATGAFIVPRIGVLVLLNVPGELEENLVIKSIEVPKYSEHGPINFGIRFENQGTVHVKPKGLVTITNWLGQKVASVPFPEKNVLPSAIRKIDATWGQKWLWAGKYTATITGSYGINNSQISPVVISFWAFPWKAGIIILIVFILILLVRKRIIAAFKILLRGEKK
ncbi:WxL protein peptidoglycan domain-containing protein [Patescibacteria group bacterium]